MVSKTLKNHSGTNKKLKNQRFYATMVGSAPSSQPTQAIVAENLVFFRFLLFLNCFLMFLERWLWFFGLFVFFDLFFNVQGTIVINWAEGMPIILKWVESIPHSLIGKSL